MTNHQLIVIGGAFLTALAIDYRKYLRAKKHNPNAKFDVIEALITAFIGVSGGGIVAANVQ